jgi:type IV pilus assembly protein PilA
MPRMDYDNRSRERGFSLVELLIVTAIILVIAALALPNFIRTRYSANEASAVSTLRLLTNVENQYAASYNTFSADLDSLGPPATGAQPSAISSDLVDTVLSGRIAGQTSQFDKGGYRFVYTPVGSFPDVKQFTIQANPLIRGNTGQRSFFADQNGIVRSNATAPAAATDSPAS